MVQHIIVLNPLWSQLGFNLVSTRSTIRDADIAEESSEYIRNQILQQAAATLMAAANQTPGIVLQLL